MLSWFFDHLGTIVVSALVLLAVFFAARHVWRGRKTISCSCGGDCAGCPGGCHSAPDLSGAPRT